MSVDVSQALEAIEKVNRAFTEFKQANDQRLQQIETKGVADPLLETRLAKITEDLEKYGKLADDYASRLNVVERFGQRSGDAAEDEKRAEAFGLAVRSRALALGRPAPESVTVEEARAYREQFRSYLRSGETHIDRRAMSVGSDPDGGYLVTPDMGGRIVTRIYDLSPIRQIASVQSTTSDRLEGLSDNGDLTGGGWVGETGSRTATTTPQLGKWTVVVHEMYENLPVTQKLLDDASVDVEAWLGRKNGDRMARREGAAFCTGTGTTQPRGFTTYTTAATADASRTWGQLEHVATGTNGSFGTNPNGADKCIDLVHRLKSGFRQNARWVTARLALAEMRKLKDAGGASANTGNYLWQPSIAAGQPSTFLGYPVTEAEDMPVYTTTDALGVAFGDFAEGYQIVDRLGITTLRDPYTNKPYVNFYTIRRVGGDVVNFDAIKFLKFGTS